MRMRGLLTSWSLAVFAVLMGLVSLTAPVHAASIVDQLFPESHLEDNDWEFLVKGSANTSTSATSLVQAGDFLVGMFEIQKLNDINSAGTFTPVAGTDTTFTGVFVIKVATAVSGTTVGGDLWQFTFEAASDAEYAALQASFSNIPNRNDSDTAVIVFEDSDNPFVDPAAASKNAALGTAANGTALWEFGFEGANVFWTATTGTNDIDAVTSCTSCLAFNSFGGALNLTHLYAGAPGLGTTTFLFPGATNVQFLGKFEPLTGNAGNNFDVQTDADFYISQTTVPQPAALLLLGSGLLAAAATGYLRRRR